MSNDSTQNPRESLSSVVSGALRMAGRELQELSGALQNLDPSDVKVFGFVFGEDARRTADVEKPKP